MNIFIVIPFFIIIFFSGCGKSISEEDKARLKLCASLVQEKNDSLLVPPAVGHWKYLTKVDSNFTGKKVTITYFFKPNKYSKESERGLNAMQHSFIKQSGCFEDEYRTVAVK